jgi:hypothetical protein
LSLFRRKNFAKKNPIRGRVSRKPQLEVLENRMVPSGFQDGFEAPTLDSFWSKTTSSGSIAVTTAQAHGGSQSVQFNSTYNLARQSRNHK